MIQKQIVERISKLGKEIYDRLEEIENLVNFDFNRVIYLGSGPLGKLTKEARLKNLELTAGEIATIWDSSMGFRHGPKSFVDENSLVISFVSSNDYTRMYDLDVLDEIENDKIAKK